MSSFGVSENNTNQMRSVYIKTYGCQMNVNDSERMESLLEMQNFTSVLTPDTADLIIVNSCSVREKPVHKVHSVIGRYRKLKEKNPNLKIGVGGCVAQQEKKQLLKDIPLLDFVFGTDSIDQLPQIIGDVFSKNEKIVSARFDYKRAYQVETLVRNPGVSTFVNITKGCDNFCTFCVVPYTRGRERSRNLNELLKDINSLVNRGVKEVTLLGQNVNSYKSDCKANFSDLLKAVAEDTDIERIRYMTSHPKDFNLELAEISQKYRKKVCDHVHLPVQSGNSEVLDRMNRGYTREHYIEKVNMLKSVIPGVAFSTDIIVGFPGETNSQFEETLSLLSLVEYDSIYAYKYSPRPFTKAARWEDQVTEEEKSDRLNRVFELQAPIGKRLSEKYLGLEKNVLVESFEENTKILSGRTTENKLTFFEGDKGMIGTYQNVKINSTTTSFIKGVLC